MITGILLSPWRSRFKTPIPSSLGAPHVETEVLELRLDEAGDGPVVLYQQYPGAPFHQLLAFRRYSTSGSSCAGTCSPLVVPDRPETIRIHYEKRVRRLSLKLGALRAAGFYIMNKRRESGRGWGQVKFGM